MSTSLALGLLALALIILAGLSGYAWSLWREVKRRKAFRADELRRAHEQCLEGLDAVARAMLSEQVDITEGALRCKVMLEIIDSRLIEREDFRVFGEVHARTAHLHTHSARQALSPRERFKEDKERLAVEDELKASALAAAKAVLVFKQRWPRSLH
ncbi:DUF2489 domain-containing protein [Halomonas salifodinae]|uniref:DUF2489 domain-containing protein n=1 Tax=Halomonas salifodinae TaxID=438745 RepID=A0ABW2F0M1_9GAMM